MSYRFRPALLPTLVTLLFVALFVRLGLWQQHKAEAKQVLQARLEQRLSQPPAPLPASIDDRESWRYRSVTVSGSYDARHQILIDNQMHGGSAGYHVITPLLPDDGGTAVLVDRGWIAAPPDRRQLPEVETPAGSQRVQGYLWLPGKFYTLEQPPATGGPWQPVWQNLDLARYAAALPYHILPLVIRLDPASDSGGFVRAWPLPAERVAMHLGYAYQWYGFALTLLVIYVVVNLKRTP